MGCFSCKTPARPRPAASRRLGSAPSTGHVLLAWRKREIRLQNTQTPSLFCFRFTTSSVRRSPLSHPQSHSFSFLFPTLLFAVCLWTVHLGAFCWASDYVSIRETGGEGSLSSMTTGRSIVLHRVTISNGNSAFLLDYKIHFSFFGTKTCRIWEQNPKITSEILQFASLTFSTTTQTCKCSM